MTALTSQAAGGGDAASVLPNFFLIGFIVLIFWFIVIAPQKKEVKEKENMRDTLKKGDQVVTAGGIHGQVAKVEKETVHIKIGAKVDITVEKSSISRIINTGASKDAEDSAG